ncbi:hypothetical protein SNOG_16454 [Parastagonospora nodorum SN15]|uniref:MINDY deubiquitinase domain-containing protein n=1 Tax=Phaeosphaeria nodorum (strain SN15 / ATCC MYA-4574 / FGSC 10173) TaxID=321614 RepID=Q0TVL0_PHANO|nr:hypothetical protein SNOG_16454 [Parastagonospora nodorum SN15]EAT76152.2 hypothetical protein SNOG_16454 [Parastagonospora nodorum SN15]
MVLRKEERPGTPADLVPAPLSKASPPYPSTPPNEHPPALPSSAHGTPYSSAPNKSPAFNIKTPDEIKKQPRNEDSDSDYSDDEWDRSDDDDFEQVHAKDVPDALKPAGGKAPVTPKTLPDALRPGPPAGIPIKRSMDNISPMPTGASSASYGAMSAVSEQSNGSIPLQTNNPYLKAQQTGQSNWGNESSQQVWGDSPAQTAKYDPVELPAFQTPTTPSHDMSYLNLGKKESLDQPPLIAIKSATPLALDFPDTHKKQKHAMPWPEEEGWGAGEHKSNTAQQAPVEARIEDQPLRKMSSTNPFVPSPPSSLPPPSATVDGELPPALPPRRSHEAMVPSMPPRPIDTGVGTATSPGPESPNTKMNRQRKEHYQIKHIRWHDVNKPGIRTSPILTQNLNGPCPLLALVNALVLSTPSGIETALVETLRTREQVSLGLLLDAVFDELMSGRRGTAAQELPDVSDLYKFLLTLHTGLNVNPMFVPDEDATNGNTTSPTQISGRVGGFENTPDMKLYRTFNIPLLHGWLPETNSEAFAAFNRVAKTYETSQYVQFQEEELDAKLQSGEALTPDEQQMFTDIHSIKEFLNRWPTQLTDFGLQSVRDSIQPGQVAILFRNDHFSTLFKDARTNRLFTLVTDQGYSGHDEIVWESLVDVNGQGSELFSGDFRPVGNTSMASQQGQQVPGQNKRTTISHWHCSYKRKKKTGSDAKLHNDSGMTKRPHKPDPTIAAHHEARIRQSSRHAATTSQPTGQLASLHHRRPTRKLRPRHSITPLKVIQRAPMHRCHNKHKEAHIKQTAHKCRSVHLVGQCPRQVGPGEGRARVRWDRMDRKIESDVL